jgi:cold-inducible RNA-binding protein
MRKSVLRESGSGTLKMAFESPARAWPTNGSASSSPHDWKTERVEKMKNIFVGNLDFAATESSVRSLFEPYGQVDRVNLVTDRDTGRSRGFAFVEMPDASQADQAIAALNGTNLDGRALNVNEARPKPEGGRGFSRGPQGGGRQRREPRW